MKRTSRFLVSALFALAFLSPCRASGPLCDEDLYARAGSLLSEGRAEEAAAAYKSMLDLSEKEIWTAQALLVCDERDIPLKLAALRAVFEGKVLIIRRTVEGRACFRLCAGLFSERSEALELAKRLPSPFREAGPYPLKLVSKGALTNAAFEPDVAPGAGSSTGSYSPPADPVSPPPVSAPLDMDAAGALFVKGLEAYNRRDLKSAESHFKQSIAMRPERFEAYNNLGAIYLEENRYEEARQVLEKAVEIEPSYANSRANLAGAYWFLGNRQEAISEAERAFRLDSHNVRYSMNLASFLFEMEKYDEARTYVNVAKMISPDNPEVLELEARIDLKAGPAPETAPAPAASGTEADAPVAAGGETAAEEEQEDKGIRKRLKKLFKKKDKDGSGEPGAGGGGE